MIIEVKSPKHRFHLEFFGKFNMITGKSGSHKTHFLNEVHRAKLNVSSVHCKCVDDDGKSVKLDRVFLFTNETVITGDYHDIFVKNSNCIIIIDESSEIIHKRDIGQVLKDTNNYVILLGRKIHGWLPISIDSIYELRKSGKLISNVPHYCYHNRDLINIGSFDYVLTEDSGAGREFFVKHFSNKTICSKYVIMNGIKLNRDAYV